MSKVEYKEKRDEVLYVKVKKKNKAYLKKVYKVKGYNTLSEYVDTWIDADRKASNG